MGENSNIEWTKHTFNPWIGCQKVGPGCDNCYAEVWDARGLQQRESRWGPHAERTRTSAGNWSKPLRWDKDAQIDAAIGVRERPRVFCASLADVFDNHFSILPEWRVALWALIRATPNLDWMLLTKRPGNIAKMLPEDWGRGYPNVWLGCTVVNQEEADRDIPKLLAVPAAVRFLSMEPLLGPVDLASWLDPAKFCESCDDGEGYGNRCGRTDIPREQQCPWGRSVQIVTEHGPFGADGQPDAITCDLQKLDLVIVGGESGPHARPMDPQHARDLRDQCVAAGVSFFFKQWGEFLPAGQRHGITLGDDAHGRAIDISTALRTGQAVAMDGVWTYRVGKKAAGRLLDGRTWDQMPGVQHG